MQSNLGRGVFEKYTFKKLNIVIIYCQKILTYSYHLKIIFDKNKNLWRNLSLESYKDKLGKNGKYASKVLGNKALTRLGCNEFIHTKYSEQYFT